MNHFSVLDICWYCDFTTLILYVKTDSPVHLWTYYSDVEPQRHPRTRVIRGLQVPWDTYFCFVAWKSLEQDEPGDTLIHTFTWTDWPICLTRWFTHRGKIAGEWSPSCGPLFKRHRTQPTLETLHPFWDGKYWDCPRISPPEPPTHWDKVLYADTEFRMDGYIWGYFFGKWVGKPAPPPDETTDVYGLDNLKDITAHIDYVEIFARCSRSYYPYGAYTMAVYTYDTLYNSSYKEIGAGFKYDSWKLTTNPHTGKPWTVDEVNNLQAGITLLGGGSFGFLCCDHVYVEVFSCHMREY